MALYYLDQAPPNQTTLATKFISIDALNIRNFAFHNLKLTSIVNQSGPANIVFKSLNNTGGCFFKDHVFGIKIPALSFGANQCSLISSVVDMPLNCSYVLSGIINCSRKWNDPGGPLRGIFDIASNIALNVCNGKSDCLLLESSLGALQIPFEYGRPFIMIIRVEIITPNISKISIFHNGKLIIQTSVHHVLINPTTTVRIHSDGNAGSVCSNFPMILTNFTIYSSYLSDAECYFIFNSLNITYNLNVVQPSNLLRADFSILKNYEIDSNKRLVQWNPSNDYNVYFYTVQQMKITDILSYLFEADRIPYIATVDSIKKSNNLNSDTVGENITILIKINNYIISNSDRNPEPIKDYPRQLNFPAPLSTLGTTLANCLFRHEGFYFDLPLNSILGLVDRRV